VTTLARLLIAAIFCVICTESHAQSPAGIWISADQRGQIEIYPCAEAGHPISNQAAMGKLCSYVNDPGSHLCGRIVKVLPNGEAELRAKGKSTSDILLKPMLCVGPASDQSWPWKGGIFNLDDEGIYRLRLAPQRTDRLMISGCALLGLVCPSSGQFIWTRAPN
jgi:hypothetical protein